jgi:hypothetical protein
LIHLPFGGLMTGATMAKPETPPKPDAGSASAALQPALDGTASVLHQAIQQQIADVLANADLTDEERQQILVAMQCPCCGAGGLSLSIKLTGGRSRPSF